MKFLVDNQLPTALCANLRSASHECHHVLGLGLDEETDREIWEFAKINGMIVISKDEDFIHLANRSNDEGFLV